MRNIVEKRAEADKDGLALCDMVSRSVMACGTSRLGDPECVLICHFDKTLCDGARANAVRSAAVVSAGKGKVHKSELGDAK